MDIQSRCGVLKEKVASDLLDAVDQRQKAAVLVAALYETSRKVLAEMGPPAKSLEYLESQGAVLELISFIAIPLVRNASAESNGVAVLAEIAEGCQDQLIKKKLSVYSQELLARLETGAGKQVSRGMARLAWPFVAGGVAAALAVYLVLPVSRPAKQAVPALPGAVLSAPWPAPLAYHASSSQPAAGATAQVPANARERADHPAEAAAPAGAEGKSGAPQGELVTKVRIANNQILVPVILKNAGEAVRAELVLDTGSTHTAIHEGLAARLHIDLRQARTGQSEVADGRLIRSRSTSIDAVVVGPFSMNWPEVDLIAYRGSEAVRDGLLGMDFLGKHRYQIDMDRELIRWF